MALLVWFTIGLAFWHFAVFVPDHFWGGIVGAFLAAAAGAISSGAIVHIAAGNSLGETDVGTALAAIPGAVIGMAIAYAIGMRREDDGAGEVV